MLPDWSWIVGLLFGATIGSFLNVVIYRLPRHISLSNPPNSFCPKCKHSLGPLDLFPLFSWLVSGGKCRYCKAPVSSRYFWVELLNGVLWAGIWYQFLLVKWEPATAIAYFLAVSALVAIIFIDAELYLIPDELNASLMVFGVGYAAYTGHWEMMLKGGLVGWGVIWGIALLGGVLLRQNSMGDGDIKMMRGVGTVLGPLLTLSSVGLAVPLGLIGGIGMLLVNRLRTRTATSSTSSRSVDGKGDPPAKDSEEGVPDPFYFRDWLITGIYYLLCLDVFALFFPGIEHWVSSLLTNPAVAEEEMEDDDWVPGATTIPFGPYLAAGAIVCMLFGGWVENGLKAYWRHATGADARMGLRGLEGAAVQYPLPPSRDLLDSLPVVWLSGRTQGFSAILDPRLQKVESGNVEQQHEAAGPKYLYMAIGMDQKMAINRLHFASGAAPLRRCALAQEERTLTTWNRNIGMAGSVTLRGESRAENA